MSTFIKAKLKKSDDQTNIDNHRVAANITEYYILYKNFDFSCHAYIKQNKLENYIKT